MHEEPRKTSASSAISAGEIIHFQEIILDRHIIAVDINIGTQLPPIIMGISYIIPKDIHIPFYINLHWNQEIRRSGSNP